MAMVRELLFLALLVCGAVPPSLLGQGRSGVLVGVSAQNVQGDNAFPVRYAARPAPDARAARREALGETSSRARGAAAALGDAHGRHRVVAHAMRACTCSRRRELAPPRAREHRARTCGASPRRPACAPQLWC